MQSCRTSLLLLFSQYTGHFFQLTEGGRGGICKFNARVLTFTPLKTFTVLISSVSWLNSVSVSLSPPPALRGSAVPFLSGGLQLVFLDAVSGPSFNMVSNQK